jgi:hypothetical protein
MACPRQHTEATRATAKAKTIAATSAGSIAANQILTRQRRFSEPTDVTETLYAVSVDLLNEFDHPGPFRLVGMVAYDLVDLDDRVQLDLFGTSARQLRLEVAIDELAERFGPHVVYRANDLTQPPGIRLAPTLDFLDCARG